MSSYRSPGEIGPHFSRPQPSYENLDRSSMLQPHGAAPPHSIAHPHSHWDHGLETHRHFSYQHPRGARTLQEHDFQQDLAAYQRAPLPPHDHPGYNSPVDEEDVLDQAHATRNTHYIPRESSRNIKTGNGPLPGGYCPAPRISSSTNPFHRLLRPHRRKARNETPVYAHGWYINAPPSSSQPDLFHPQQVDHTPSTSEPSESTESEGCSPSNALGLH